MQVGAAERAEDQGRLIGRIPVRNIWLLFLYASNLARFSGQHAAEVEESPDFPSLIARLLCFAVDRRLRRNLSRGYQQREAILPRVRGRIDLLETFTGDLLSKGLIACRFEEFTFDTPRNRLVRAALDAVANRVDDPVLAHDCRRLAGDLGRQGVGGLKPSRAELATERIGRHDADDLLMVTLARLVFDLVLPTEDVGGHALTRVEKDEILVRHLFQKAIGNFYAAELAPFGWKVTQGKWLDWQIEEASAGIAGLFPAMTTDIILEHPGQARRIIIDTKFTAILRRSQHREAVFKSGYIYQLYAYLRSQERPEEQLSQSTEGVLLHPTVDEEVDEFVRIQGHGMRFVTVDLMLPTIEILHRLRSLPQRALLDTVPPDELALRGK
jgi:5-methylcytosine-specific restriction enzyme subunit McrC